MTLAAPVPPPAPDTDAGYAAVLHSYRLRFSRGGAAAAIVLVMLGMGLDAALYPQHQWRFGLARVVVSVAMGAIIALLRTGWGERQVQALTFAWLMLPQIMIAWMIASTEGAQSIYYAGLNLAVFASGIALAIHLWQSVLLGLLTYLLYVLACYVHAGSVVWQGQFAVNSLFLLFTVAGSAVCTYFNEQGRFGIFRLRAELEAKNAQLEENNRNLVEIKGQMMHQEKMAALGTLAAGLLHEVNNPVNYCRMAIELAAEDPAAKASPMLLESLADARQGMQRVQYIVSDLKSFAYRKSGLEHASEQFPLERALDSALRMVGHELKGVAVRRDIVPGAVVRGDEAAIAGVLINLLGNAALAMRQAGTAQPAITVSVSATGGRLLVAVQDNGPGILPEHLGRVFEPFFTTREIGQGLGLGLSICYSVIQRHGGLLAAESQAGQWTRFSFDLPQIKQNKEVHEQHYG